MSWLILSPNINCKATQYRYVSMLSAHLNKRFVYLYITQGAHSTRYIPKLYILLRFRISCITLNKQCNTLTHSKCTQSYSQKLNYSGTQ